MNRIFLLLAMGATALLMAEPYYPSQPYYAPPPPQPYGGYYGGCPNCNHDNAAPYQHETHYRTANPLPDIAMDDPRYSPTRLVADNNKPKTQKVVSDDDIARNVHRLIDADWFSKGYPEVIFEVTNGNVTLKGFIDTEEDKNRLEANIKQINGVKKVSNQIKSRGNKAAFSYYEPAIAEATKAMASSDKALNTRDFAATDADLELNHRIRHKLSGGWFSRGYKDLTIQTTNGVVTVTGTVDRVDDIQKVTDIIQKVDRVKSVNNQATVKMQ